MTGSSIHGLPRPARGALASLLIGVACAGCSQSDGRTVSGRTRSVTAAVAPGARAPVSATLRLSATTEQATGLSRARFEVVAAVGTASRAVLRLAGGTTEQPLEPLPLAADGVPRMGLTVEGTQAEVRGRFPTGAYTVVADLPDGTQPSVTLILGSDLPAPPRVLAPADLAVGVSARPLLAWSWSGPAPRFDVTITDVLTGAVAFTASDVLDTSVAVPAGASLAPSRRYRLEVRAVSAPGSSGARAESGITTLFDTGAP